LILFAFSNFQTDSYADYGELFLSVTCDADHDEFIIQPLIIWNEELDRVDEALKKNKGVITDGYRSLYDCRFFNFNVNGTCRLNDKSIEFTAKDSYKPKLIIRENNKPVISIGIGSVWDVYGYIFKLRYTPQGGYEEYCGHEGHELKWKPFNNQRVDTNCVVDRK
jgi:hypothetical protein